MPNLNKSLTLAEFPAAVCAKVAGEHGGCCGPNPPAYEVSANGVVLGRGQGPQAAWKKATEWLPQKAQKQGGAA